MNVIKTSRYIDVLKREANLYVALPKGYERQPSQRYPVLYFHDGHNLFFKADSYAGEIWDVVGALKTKGLPPCIVVALNCASKGNHRLEEYNIFDTRFPSHPTWVAHGRGMDYLQYLLFDLKQEIDQTYRTLPAAEHTYMIGSSMGGVISLEAGLLYPEIVGHVAGLSNAFYASTKQILKLIEDKPLLLKTLYLDTGDQESGLEVNDVYMKSNFAVKDAIEKKSSKTRFQFQIIPGGEHNESAWRKRLPKILTFLFKS